MTKNKVQQTTGWLDNYNDSKVTLPKTFKGEGFTSYNWKSPAWGGQFELGGSIPGANAFMYARHGAPSEGSYAKKTMPSAENGQEMSFYQQGKDWLPKSMQVGGIVQDDNGYWNPDNWGHPVEIDSNQITMQGVNQPLLGISDTGDKKMMVPGKDYKFKGKKVQEFPVSKNGNALTRLDQLTNFTNYNTKQPGGWLDKWK